MNSPASVMGPSDGLSGRAPKRALVAIGLSLAAHVLLVGGLVLGPFDWHAPEEPVVVQARLLPPPPAPAPAPQLQPETQLQAPPQRRPATPHVTHHAPPVLRSPVPSDTVVADGTPSPDAAADPSPPAPVQAPTLPAPPSAALAPAPAAAIKPPPLPAHARIEYELNIESKNFRATTVQDWHMRDGRYSVGMRGSALIFIKVFSVDFESSGSVAGGRLQPEHYSDNRDGRVNAIDFDAQAKVANVHEASGNQKSVALTAPPTDPMSLPYALAMNPDMPIGTVLMAANKENVEPVRLVERRDEPLYTDHFAANTRFYDFRRPDGSGGVQVWLSLDKHWLPVKLRIAGRDGPVSFTATRYEFDPPSK